MGEVSRNRRFLCENMTLSVPSVHLVLIWYYHQQYFDYYFLLRNFASGFFVFSDFNFNVIDLLRESDAATFSPMNEFEVLKKEESCLLVKDTYDNSEWKQQIIACMIHCLRSRTIVNFYYCFLKLHICIWRIDLRYENTALYAIAHH